MLVDVAESAAQGRVAEVYAQLRRSCGVPYVSSLQRFLAARPEWLIWCWDAVGPGFEAGWIPAAGWRAAEGLEVPALAPIPGAALREWGVGGQDLSAIANVCDNFIRVSPVNLMFSGIARRLLAGERPRQTATEQAVPAPAPLPPMPDMAPLESLSPDVKSLLDRLGTEVDGERFVPALYRLLASWPGFLAHASVVLQPLFDDDAVVAACTTLSRAADVQVDGIWQAVKDPGPAPAPSDHARSISLIAAIDRYRVTSPQMVVFATMLRRATID